MSLSTFEDLEVWRRASRLAVDVCVAYHESKNYALKDQLIRSSLSIPSNIAEGAERDADGDFKRFLRIAKGSCGELRTQLYIDQRTRESLGLPVPEALSSFISETREIAAMLQGLISSIDRRSNHSEN
ncbi:four helix bundle protein [Sulfuriroseicoccus oceanibius]|uniref:Four helix bundle protein n=2 Tax=Sulfuriroseicoccus oceanibius TaxID=2707525 RepID=A0A6B3LFQ5_9BACT|nr:four helix bundle protein [Sulfuriroseicoccus oceanibius]